MQQPHIFIATPCYGGVVTQDYMQSVCALMAAAPAAGIDLTLGLLGQDALITRSRNTLLSHFMAHPGTTHILFIDADISFEPDNVLRLLKARKPITAGIYPLKAYYWDQAFRDRCDGGEAIESAGLHYVGKLEQSERLRREGDFATATYAGTGFMLIAREVIKRLISAYPETAYDGVDAYQTINTTQPKAYALFDCMIDPQTKKYLSEDFTFCHRWRHVGGEIWIDTRGRLTHAGPSSYHGAPACRFS